MTSRPATITRRTLVVLAVAMAAGLLTTTPAHAGAFTVTATPTATWCAPSPNGAFIVSSNYPPYFGFHCSGTFQLTGDPAGSAGGGDYATAQIDSPPGITITGATVTGEISYFGSGWAGGSFFAGGGTAWPNNLMTVTDPSFASNYWGWEVECVPGATCTGAGRLNLSSIKLTASETQGPLLTAQGPNNLWFQDRAGEWIWNAPGDAWPLTLAASDPSGVCSMSADVRDTELPGPSAVPNTTKWQQCPNAAWAPTGGAAIDTQDYVAGTGSLPLKINATNAAGVTSSYSETLQVDNEPVSVALNATNDANPSVWVNHGVTVDPTASAGPSGVGGTDCTVDGAGAYPAAGVTVNGDGVRTLSCTAWNNAVGPEGQPDTGTSSMAILIDEAPPSITIEPPNPGDPTGLVVDTSDSESGVASGSVQMAPAGSTSWTSLPASVSGAHLVSRLEDAGLHGPYIVRATSCDNVGNCATTSETLTMPLRLNAASDVGFAKIGTPTRVVRERVLVDFRLKRERRRGQVIEVETGGHYRTIHIVIGANARCAHKLIKTGPHRWQEITVCRPLKLNVITSEQVPYGKPFTLHGLLVTAAGVPVANVPVSIFTAPNNGLNQFTQAATATTTNAGAWTARLPRGPSRIIRAVYGGSDTLLPAAGQATVNVPARIALSATPRGVPWDGAVTLRGHLDGGHVPRDGVALRLLIRLPHRAQPYEPVPFRTNAKGDFVVRWSWGTGSGVVSYPFAVATTATESDYPFAAARSRWIPVNFGSG